MEGLRHDMVRMPSVDEKNGSGRNNSSSKSTRASGIRLSTAGSGQSAYVPVTAEAVQNTSFRWKQACSVYSIQGSQVSHRGGGKQPYRPVIGDLIMRPGTGKYFFSYRVNTDNCRVGFCTENVYSEDALTDLEFGRGVTTGTTDLCSPRDTEGAQPSYLQRIGAVPPPPGKPWEMYIDLQTSRIYVNGVEKKQLWRLFTPTCGGLLSFVVDTDTGAVQLFVDGQYVGMMVSDEYGMKGKTIVPAVGLSGYDMANRSISPGYMAATVSPAEKFNCLY